MPVLTEMSSPDRCKIEWNFSSWLIEIYTFENCNTQWYFVLLYLLAVLLAKTHARFNSPVLGVGKT